MSISTQRARSCLVRPGTVLLTDGGVIGSASAPFITATPKTSAWMMNDPTVDQNGAGCCAASAASADQNWAAPNARHLDTAVVGFADGHVKSMRVSQFYYSNSPWLDPARGGP